MRVATPSNATLMKHRPPINDERGIDDWKVAACAAEVLRMPRPIQREDVGTCDDLATAIAVWHDSWAKPVFRIRRPRRTR